VLRVSGDRCWVWGAMFLVSVFVFGVWGSVFLVSGFEFSLPICEVWGLGFGLKEYLDRDGVGGRVADDYHVPDAVLLQGSREPGSGFRFRPTDSRSKYRDQLTH
jgi:hypothetical protein